jgi:hypothetical protein
MYNITLLFLLILVFILTASQPVKSTVIIEDVNPSIEKNMSRTQADSVTIDSAELKCADVVLQGSHGLCQ